MVIEIPLSKTGKHAGKFFAKVDEEDRELAELNWTVRASNRTQYARRTVSSKPYRDVSLHVEIAIRMFGEIPEGMEVDHIDNDGLNCCRSNIRLAKPFQNRANTRRYKNNTSGFKGVSFNTKVGRYTAAIQSNRKFKRLGYFDTKEEAYEAYCKAADELHEEFANHG
jgi:hypothetical protein